ncbi:MAG TPA: hypothetical protein PKZ52_05600 [Cellvibrionaceae bacterium]|nr:hypothetical protein [Cellvibrionaceae bacterium]
MRKRTLLSRIAVLNHGKKAYLEYLRNLTPQSALLVFALLAAYKIYGTDASPHNGWDTFILIALLTLCFLSFIANTHTFYEACYKRPLLVFICRTIRLIKSKKMTPTKTKCTVAVALAKRKSIELVEVLISFVLLQITLAVVITSAI